ncbi:MAG: nucleotidyltransferase family protein [Candidatus Acidiferrales bacterium]
MTRPRAEEIRPEMQLLLCCARTRLGASHIERIRVLVRPDLNWAAFMALADQHALIPLVHLHLSKFSARVPSLWLERMEKAARSNAIRALFLGNELARILDVFQSRKITAIPYKGPVLAAQAYLDTSLRQFDDLDIIVPQSDLAAAHEAMLALEYRARFPWKRGAETATSRIPGEYTYRGSGQSLVELHTEFTMRHFPVRLNIAHFANRLAQVSVDGRNVATFRAEDALPVLCVHGAKDFWERLSWLVDLGALLETSVRLDWDAVFETADSLGARRMLFLGISIAQELTEVSLPNSIREKIEADGAVAALATLIQRKMVIEKQTWSAASRLRFRFALVENRGEATRYVWRLATAPAEDEWPGEDTSAFASRLQAMLRPFRLARKHSAAAPHSEQNPF